MRNMSILLVFGLFIASAIVHSQTVTVTDQILNSPGNSSKRFSTGSFVTTFNAQAFSVHRNGTGQSITSGGSGELIAWTTEDFDTNNVFNLTTDIATLTEGYWSLCVAVTFNSCVDTAVVRSVLRKNGSSIAQLDSQCSTNSKVQSSISCKTVFSDGDDQFDTYAFQDTGSALTLSGSANSTWFTGQRIF